MTTRHSHRPIDSNFGDGRPSSTRLDPSHHSSPSTSAKASAMSRPLQHSHPSFFGLPPTAISFISTQRIPTPKAYFSRQQPACSPPEGQAHIFAMSEHHPRDFHHTKASLLFSTSPRGHPLQSCLENLVSSGGSLLDWASCTRDRKSQIRKFCSKPAQSTGESQAQLKGRIFRGFPPSLQFPQHSFPPPHSALPPTDSFASITALQLSLHRSIASITPSLPSLFCIRRRARCRLVANFQVSRWFFLSQHLLTQTHRS